MGHGPMVLLGHHSIDLDGEELAAYAALADLVVVISKTLTSTDMIWISHKFIFNVRKVRIPIL